MGPIIIFIGALSKHMHGFCLLHTIDCETAIILLHSSYTLGPMLLCPAFCQSSFTGVHSSQSQSSKKEEAAIKN